jgi:hypothetical protein
MEAAVTALFDEATNTVSYIVADPATAKPAIVDCVLDFNPKSADLDMFGGPADRSRPAAGPGGRVDSGDARPRRPSIGRPRTSRRSSVVDILPLQPVAVFFEPGASDLHEDARFARDSLLEQSGFEPSVPLTSGSRAKPR